MIFAHHVNLEQFSFLLQCAVTFQILRSKNIEFVVAPYEADAQLAYLATLEAEKGGVVAVITEDSDLIAYGCPAVRTSPKL